VVVAQDGTDNHVPSVLGTARLLSSSMCRAFPRGGHGSYGYGAAASRFVQLRIAPGPARLHSHTAVCFSCTLSGSHMGGVRLVIGALVRTVAAALCCARLGWAQTSAQPFRLDYSEASGCAAREEFYWQLQARTRFYFGPSADKGTVYRTPVAGLTAGVRAGVHFP
jgi:hypothetical protein